MFIVRSGVCLGLFALALAFSGEAAAAEKVAKAQDKDQVVIGMPASLFQGIPKYFIDLGTEPFLKLMKESTGVNGKVLHLSNAMEMADKMHEGKVQIGVFQGHEFAFAKLKHPKLTPIVLASPMVPVQAYCVVRWDCKATNIGELKDQKISIPEVHRDFCDIFLVKQKNEHMKGKEFAAVIRASSATDAIFSVIEKNCACTVIDGTTYEYFKSNYPGQFKNLKVLCKSEVFPNACVAVRKGELDQKTLEKFRRALLDAPALKGGPAMLLNFKINGFVNVPDTYQELLNKVQQGYAPPASFRTITEK